MTDDPPRAPVRYIPARLSCRSSRRCWQWWHSVAASDWTIPARSWSQNLCKVCKRRARISFHFGGAMQRLKCHLADDPKEIQFSAEPRATHCQKIYFQHVRPIFQRKFIHVCAPHSQWLLWGEEWQHHRPHNGTKSHSCLFYSALVDFSRDLC